MEHVIHKVCFLNTIVDMKTFYCHNAVHKENNVGWHQVRSQIQVKDWENLLFFPSMTSYWHKSSMKKESPPIHVGKEVFVNIVINKVINTMFGGVLQVKRNFVIEDDREITITFERPLYMHASLFSLD